jgi:hypothetical protein
MVAIVIVNYHTNHMVRAAAESILCTAADIDHEILVVDNSPGHGLEEALADLRDSVRIMPAPSNLGFAAACNWAAGQARGEWILLVNPDVVVLPGAIQALLELARTRPDAGIYGGRTVNADGTLNPASCWRTLSLWTLACRVLALDTLWPGSPLLNRQGYGGWDRSGVAGVDVVSGCFMLISRALWDRLDGFDERFFVYGEDADLCLRARRLGYRPYITSQATVVHEGGGSEKLKSGKMVRLLIAKAQFIEKHYPGMRGRLMMTALMTWPWSRYAAFRLATPLNRSRFGVGRATWQSVWRDVRHFRGYGSRPV